jgi:hypothetical protein
MKCTKMYFKSLRLLQYFQKRVLVRKKDHLPVVNEEWQKKEHAGQNVRSSNNTGHL